jgi:hypothetical protein
MSFSSRLWLKTRRVVAFFSFHGYSLDYKLVNFFPLSVRNLALACVCCLKKGKSTLKVPQLVIEL